VNEARRGGPVRRIATGPVGRVGLPLLVVAAIFAGVLPRLTSYSAAWHLVQGLSRSEVLLIAVLATLNLASYAPLWMAAIPGLGWWRATLAEQASTAVANTVPVGFTFGVGTVAAIFHSFGLSAATITRGIALTGLWNNLVKLGMPAVALAGLAVTGDVTSGLLFAAVLGAALLLVVVAVLVLVLTHPAAGAAVALVGERLLGRLARLAHRPGPSGWVVAVDRFRTDSLALVRSRWPLLTVAAVGSHVALFALLLACVRLVDGAGSEVDWLRVLAVFAVTRLLTMVPITPGALGVAELSYVAGLTAVGMNSSAAGAAVLVFRFLTWFVPIPFGAVALLMWRRTAHVPPARPARSTAAGV